MIYQTHVKHSTIMYADDITLFTTIQLSNTCSTKHFEYHLNLHLNKIYEWLKINKLSLNVKKSKYTIHKLGNKQVNNLILEIDETIIKKRIICLTKYNAYTEPLFKKLKILNVTDMLKLHELKLTLLRKHTLFYRITKYCAHYQTVIYVDSRNNRRTIL